MSTSSISAPYVRAPSRTASTNFRIRLFFLRALVFIPSTFIVNPRLLAIWQRVVIEVSTGPRTYLYSVSGIDLN